MSGYSLLRVKFFQFHLFHCTDFFTGNAKTKVFYRTREKKLKILQKSILKLLHFYKLIYLGKARATILRKITHYSQ